jgi:hypothetical protein
MTVLLGDDAILDRVQELSNDPDFAGDDPERILSTLMCGASRLLVLELHSQALSAILTPGRFGSYINSSHVPVTGLHGDILQGYAIVKACPIMHVPYLGCTGVLC